MKRGYRKLCDVHCHLAHAVEIREYLEAYLASSKIAYEVHSHRDRKTDRDFWRYAVALADLRRAQGGIPLKLRGFRAVSEGA